MKDINAISNTEGVTLNPNWQVQCRGKDWDEYQIYVAQISSLGIPVKSFDEWLNS